MAIDDPGMTDQEERAAASLRRALRDVAEEHPVRVDGAAWVRGAANRRTSLSLRLALAGALVLALLVALGGMGAFHTRPRATSTPTQVTSATNATNSPSPSQAESGPVIGPWEDTLSLSEKLSQIINSDMDESFGSASNGVVAIKVYGAAPGGEPIQHIVSVYRSFDGRTWTETQVPNPNNAQDAAVACRGASCVVVVQSGGEAGILEVTDDGRDWSELPLPSNLWQSSIVAGNDCFLLYGFDTTTGQYKLLRSPDGENWTSTVYATGSPPLTKGLWVGYDPTAGWIALGGFADGQSAEGRVPIATSKDGLTWTDAIDESAVYKVASEVSQSVVHFGDRWYLYASYATFPNGGRSLGPFPGFQQASPTASWQTVYWLQDGSQVIHSNGIVSAILPDEALSMGGYLIGLKPEDDGTTRLLTSTDAVTWTPAGLVPPGEPDQSSMRGVPQIARVGSSMVAFSPDAAGGVVGAELYLATPTGL
jgi:hypothetical protein